MLPVAVWAAVLFVASGDPVKSSNFVGELTVAQLKELILQTVLEAPLLNSTCKDHPDVSDCDAIVESGLCTQEESYARFCCRSCTLARQIPTYGPHLRQTATTDIIVTANSEYTVTGSDFTISCSASSFPVPKIIWYCAHSRIILGASYEQKDELDEILPENPVFTVGEEMTLKCASRGRDLKSLVWLTTLQRIPVGKQYRITENSMTEEGVTTLRSSLTVLLNESGCLFYECQAVYKDGYKVAVDSKSVRVEALVPNCSNVGDLKECIQNRQLCGTNYRRMMVAYCCRTCAFEYDGSIEPVSIEDSLTVDVSGMSRPYGKYVMMVCSSRGVPGNQSVTWYFGNTTIQNSNKYHVREDRRCEYFMCSVRSIIIISRVILEDLGRYVCRATNGIVTKEETRFLTMSSEGNILIEPTDNTKHDPPTHNDYMRDYGGYCSPEFPSPV